MVSYLQPKTKSVRQIQTESFRRSKRIEHSITKKKLFEFPSISRLPTRHCQREDTFTPFISLPTKCKNQYNFLTNLY